MALEPTTELGQVIPLLFKAVESFSRLDVKVESMGRDISLLREENKDLIGKMTGTLERLAEISANIAANTNDHKSIHKRIDAIESGLAAIETESEDIEHAVHDIQKSCQASGHQELLKKINAMEKTLETLNQSLKLITYSIQGIPVWLMLLVMVLLGFASDLANHIDWLKKWWPF